MKKLLVTFILCHVTSAITFAQLGSWLQRANFGGAGRSNGVGFSIGNKGYIGTGYAGTYQKDFWQYDPVANSWTQKADFGGEARMAAVGFSIGGKGYIGTGRDLNNTYTQDFWEYDTTSNAWTQKTDFAGAGRFYAAGFSIGTKGYIGTGMDASVAYTNFYEYDPSSDAWTAKANFGSSARADCFGMAVNGKGYIGCGRNFSGSTFYNTFYEYDPTPNTWTARANFGGVAREGVSAFVIGNFGYAGTGSTNNFNTQYTDFYKYDPVGNAWTAIAAFAGTSRTNAVGFGIGNLGYVGTGYAVSAYTTTFYQYDLCGITTTVTATSPACNGGNNGSINLTVSNATNPLTYAWSNSSTVQDPTGLAAGGYTVTVTDGVGCTKTTTITVTEPTPIAGNITTVTNASCNSLCNGKITVSASGATPPYTYAWSPSGGASATATGLCAGNYSVTITDSKGCSVMKDSVVTEPTAMTATATPVNATSACSCDGMLVPSASGGTPGYTYLWTPSNCTDTCSNICGSNTTYTLTVTDSMGCTKSSTASISPVALTVSLTATPATCPTCTDGDATANPSGGTAPFTYSWNIGQTTQTATGLSPGMYPVCVIDSDSCYKCDSIYVGWAIGINELSSSDISVSPNPSHDGIIMIAGLKSPAQITISNLVGKIVYQSATNRKQEAIKLNDANGIYFLNIKSEEGVLTKKVILRR